MLDDKSNKVFTTKQIDQLRCWAEDEIIEHRRRAKHSVMTYNRGYYNGWSDGCSRLKRKLETYLNG